MFSSLNCAGSRSSKLQRRTTTLNKKKQPTSAPTLAPPLPRPDETRVVEPTTTGGGASAPPPYLASDNLPDLTISLHSGKKLGGKMLRLDSTPEGESFWDLGNYKYVLRRCDNGSKLSTELADMITERAKLEESYAKSLRQWAKKWNEHLDNESVEYGTTKDAWYAFLEVRYIHFYALYWWYLFNSLLNQGGRAYSRCSLGRMQDHSQQSSVQDQRVDEEKVRETLHQLQANERV